MQGAITRAKAHQLIQQVNLFLCSFIHEFENRLLLNDVIVLRNQGKEHGGLMEHQGCDGRPRGSAQHVGSRVQLGA
jgi:hypothetical protein